MKEIEFKRTGYSGKFLKLIEMYTLTSEQIDDYKNKIRDIRNAIIAEGILKSGDVPLLDDGAVIKLPSSDVTTYSFGIEDDELELFLNFCKRISLTLSSGISFDPEGIWIKSFLNLGELPIVKDSLSLSHTINAFNFGNRIAVARTRIQDGEAIIEISTNISSLVSSEKIYKLSMIHVRSINRFILGLSKINYTVESWSNLGEDLKNIINPKRVLLVYGLEKKNSQVINSVLDFLKLQGLNCVLSNDQQAIILLGTIKTTKSSFESELYISFSIWPNSLSFYCKLDVNASINAEVLLTLGQGHVYMKNIAFEIINGSIGVSHFIFAMENFLTSTLIIQEIEMLFGFIEYHLDYYEKQ